MTIHYVDRKYDITTDSLPRQGTISVSGKLGIANLRYHIALSAYFASIQIDIFDGLFPLMFSDSGGISTLVRHAHVSRRP